jgi:hypothetical protein
VISPEFNFLEFIRVVKDKDKPDILRLAESEATEAEKVSEIKGYGQNYTEGVRGFIYLIRYCQKPDGIKEEYLQMSRSVCEKLVARKQLLPEVLKIFDSNHW